MLKEFKSFILKGNVLDLAVAVIMATYFGSIVKSLVDDIIMPIIGQLIGGIDIKDYKWVIQEASNANGEEIAEVAIRIGLFINHIVVFLIVGFSIFLVVKAANRMMKKKEEAPAEPPAPPRNEVLLEEIRDLLKK